MNRAKKCTTNVTTILTKNGGRYYSRVDCKMGPFY